MSISMNLRLGRIEQRGNLRSPRTFCAFSANLDLANQGNLADFALRLGHTPGISIFSFYIAQVIDLIDNDGSWVIALKKVLADGLSSDDR